MDWVFTAVMGIVQGLSEFLPISSSGHLIVAEKLLGLIGYQTEGSAIAFYVMLHMGTLVAVAAVFWKDWLHMLRHPIKDRTLLLLFIASLPALLVKLLLGDAIDGLFTGWFLGISFLITALFLALIEVFSRRGARHRAKRQFPDIPDALVMGALQGVALLPGVSRSGSTLLGGIIRGLDRGAAAKFSFMMSAPAILGSFLAEGKTAVEEFGVSSLFSGTTLLGLALAAISGYLAIRYMLKLIQRISFFHFAIYVALVGVAVIIMQVTGFAGFPPIALPGSGAG
ncbi:MAG: undecaprenyl-diphosphate phosphatase [Eubacteriales bacterium]|nr:undecaprenyl-diphosphate phosphatase [Eubacteriales bacterium]